MEWLGRILYPKARPYERRSRMKLIYLLAVLAILASIVLVVALWFMNKPTRY